MPNGAASFRGAVFLRNAMPITAIALPDARAIASR